MIKFSNKLTQKYIYTELADIVGRDHITTSMVDKIAYSADFSWVSEMWIDRGQQPPTADFILHPGSTREVAEIVKVANCYRIPVIPWGGGVRIPGGCDSGFRGHHRGFEKTEPYHRG